MLGSSGINTYWYFSPKLRLSQINWLRPGMSGVRVVGETELPRKITADYPDDHTCVLSACSQVSYWEHVHNHWVRLVQFSEDAGGVSLLHLLPLSCTSLV